MDVDLKHLASLASASALGSTYGEEATTASALGSMNAGEEAPSFKVIDGYLDLSGAMCGGGGGVVRASNLKSAYNESNFFPNCRTVPRGARMRMWGLMAWGYANNANSLAV